MTRDFSCIASQGVEPPSTFSSPRQRTGPVGRDCPPWPATQTLLRRPPAHRSGQGSGHRCPIHPDGLRADLRSQKKNARPIKNACWYPWCAWPAQQSHRPSFTEDRCTKGPSPDAEFQQTPVHSHHRLTNTWIGPFSQLQANSEDDKPVPIMSCLHLSRI